MKKQEKNNELKIQFNKDIENIKKELKSKPKEKAYFLYSFFNVEDYKKSLAVFVDQKIENKFIIKPYDKNKVERVSYYEHNYDDYFLKYLEGKYEIANIEMFAHYSAWLQISNLYPNIVNKKGLQSYLKYCKDNKITRDRILKEAGATRLFNIMKYYKKDSKER